MECTTKFAAHGAEQKLGDEIAGLEDVDDCVIAIDSLIDRLYNGEWSVKREAGGMAGNYAVSNQKGKSFPRVPGVVPQRAATFP